MTVRARPSPLMGGSIPAQACVSYAAVSTGSSCRYLGGSWWPVLPPGTLPDIAQMRHLHTASGRHSEAAEVCARLATASSTYCWVESSSANILGEHWLEYVKGRHTLQRQKSLSRVSQCIVPGANQVCFAMLLPAAERSREDRQHLRGTAEAHQQHIKQTLLTHSSSS